MARLDEEALAQDIMLLRELIDRLLDDGRPPDDLRLVAASMLLTEKLDQFRTRSLDDRDRTGSG